MPDARCAGRETGDAQAARRWRASRQKCRSYSKFVGRWACSVCRSDILVTIRAGRLVYAVLIFIGPPLAGIAAEMPLLRRYRGGKAAARVNAWAAGGGALGAGRWACSGWRSDIIVTIRAGMCV